jgi:hypothetical protein
MRATIAADPTDVPFRMLPAFLLTTFGLTWGIFALLVLVPDSMEAVFGPVSNRHPLFILAVYAPAIAAFVFVLRIGGGAAFGRFLSRLLLWRCPWPWVAVLLVGIRLRICPTVCQIPSGRGRPIQCPHQARPSMEQWCVADLSSEPVPHPPI